MTNDALVLEYNTHIIYRNKKIKALRVERSPFHKNRTAIKIVSYSDVPSGAIIKYNDILYRTSVTTVEYLCDGDGIKHLYKTYADLLGGDNNEHSG